MKFGIIIGISYLLMGFYGKLVSDYNMEMMRADRTGKVSGLLKVMVYTVAVSAFLMVIAAFAVVISCLYVPEFWEKNFFSCTWVVCGVYMVIVRLSNLVMDVKVMGKEW